MEIRRKTFSRQRLCLIRPLLFSTSQRWAPSVISLASTASLQRRCVEDLYLRLSLFLTATSQSSFTNRFLLIAPCRLRADGTEALRTSYAEIEAADTLAVFRLAVNRATSLEAELDRLAVAGEFRDQLTKHAMYASQSSARQSLAMEITRCTADF